ncbi:2'-5' RNA ligase family protein [Actinoplanes sp. NPDC051633]|uniref:2'-5' RNA ligase family protein n=1 Tax=Actinoplanes sp. NPDC051633 TaxID=3155670 RepID=UPI00342DC685
MEDLQTALLVVVPEAEEAVGRHRARLDRAARWNVPAHITVLFPFLPLPDIDLGELRELFRALPAFAGRLERVGWFGDVVAWLAPEPAHRFRGLTETVWRRYPQAPPFEGAFDEVVPHLTIGHDHPRPELERAAAQAAEHLPIDFAVDHVRLMAGKVGVQAWRSVAELPLGYLRATPGLTRTAGPP